MPYVCPAAARAVVLFVLAPFAVVGQSEPPALSITNYQYIGEQRFSQTVSYVTYRADLLNRGKAREAVMASLTSQVPSVQVTPGQGNLRFSPVPANSQVTSGNTFTLLVDRSVPFSFSNLQWTFLSPIANAGPNQTVKVGDTATLDGGGSTNPSGYGVLSYNWTFTQRPPGTGTVLLYATAVRPSFIVDVPGDYVLTLTVSNGGGTDSARVTVSTINSAPAANAGPNQTVPLGANVTLNGSASSDVDGDPLTYSWTLLSRPAGSSAALLGTATVAPVFVVDKPGAYLAQLVVNDGKADSAPATVTITTQNTPPVANAGPNQMASLNGLVQLNGSGSSDVDGDLLSYRWSLIGLPSGSLAALNNPDAVNPTFTIDRPGTYVAQLIVNDGKADSAPPATVSITTNPVLAPTANAGLNQTVAHRATVHLSGGGTDPQELALTYLWSFTTKPPGCTAVLLNHTAATPQFVADLPGTYVAQLIVNNGYAASAPATVTIATTNTAPVAAAGPNQSVPAGSQVLLDGSGSSDSDGDPLTYSWSFNSRPAGSGATLSAAATVSPAFAADVAGTYVLQLIVNDGFANSAPSTVTVVAGIRTITLTPNPLTLAPNESAVLTVTLGSPAGSGGQVVHLSSDNASVAGVQASVTIPEGLTGANATVTGGGTGTAGITATGTGYSAGTATVNVVSPVFTVTLDGANLGLTRTMNGTVTLSRSAPAGGTAVALSANPAGIVTLQPASVTIAAGTTTATFSLTGAALGSTTIVATAPGHTSGSAGVTVGMLGAITVPSGVTVGLNQSVPFAVKLATGAPMGGVTITLSSSNPAVVSISPTTVDIPFSATVPDVQPQVTGLNFGAVSISASAPGFFGDHQTVEVTASLNFSPSTLTMGVNATQNLTLTLSGPAPAALAVNLSSSNTGVATVPGSVTIPAGATSVAVPVTAVANGLAVIHASALPSLPETTASVTVVNFGPVGLPQNVSVGLGQSVSFPVTLPTPAPAGGATVNLSSSDPAKVTITPAGVTIAPGQTAPGTQPQVKGIDLGTASITATTTGYASANAPVRVTATLSFSPGSLTISGAVTRDLTLNLPAAAPTPVKVDLTSSNMAVATVPASVTFPANTATVSVPVTGLTVGTTVIHAGGANLAEATANVSVQSAGAINVPSNATVGLGQSKPLAISLPAAAPAGGVIIALNSSDTSKVTISPATVTVAAGQTTPPAQPEVTGVNLGTANITASAPGYTAASVQVQVTATIAFPQNLTISGYTTQNLALTLSAPAPTSVTVNVTSGNTAVATVPASVTFPANATTVNVPVTGVALGTVVIHASALPNIAEATANVTVQNAGGIILPTGTKLALGQSAPFALTLPAPAPANGVTVTLTSSDTGKVTVSPATVTVAAGQTAPATQPQVTGAGLGTADITASAPGYTAGTASVQVTATVTFSPPALTITGTATQNLTLTLSAPAPAGGLAVNLSSSNTAVATVPGSVTFAASATTATVPVTGVAAGTAKVHASAFPNVADTAADITVQNTGAIVLATGTSVEVGQSAAFAVSLSTAAPAGGITIALASSDTGKVTISPSSVTIDAGKTTPASQPQVSGVSVGSANITASATGYSAVSQSVQVTGKLSFAPATLTMTGFAPRNLTLNLSAPAPAGGLTVNLSSSNTNVATVPASVNVAGNATSVTVPVTGTGFGQAVIHAGATPLFPDTTANVTVQGAGALSLPAAVTVGLGQAATLAVTLPGPAPAGGVTVTLASGDSSKVTLTATSVSIAENATAPATQPKVNGVNFGTVTVTATAPGYTAATSSVQVTGSLSFSPPTLTITGTGTQNLALNLSGPAPAGGLTIGLSSSNPAAVTVPPNVTFGAGAASVNVPVTGIAQGMAVIHAGAPPNLADTTADVVVQSGIILPSNLKVEPGQNVPFPVTLSSPASGSVFISLASSDPSKVTLSAQTIVIQDGQTAPSGTPRINGLNYGIATITASATGYMPASQQVQVGATLNFVPANMTILGTVTQPIGLALSSTAPGGGLVVNLSSSNTAVATVPASVTIAAGTMNVSVPVTALAVGSATITASTSIPTVPSATAAITVTAPGSITVPSNLTVSLAQTVPFPITLGSPAPAQGLTVTLASSNPARIALSSTTVSIAAGNTQPAVQPQVTCGDVGPSTITVSAPGYNTATTTVTGTATMRFLQPNITVVGTATQNLSLALSAALPFTGPPQTGIKVDLTSSNPAVATVQSTLTFYPDGSDVTTLIIPVTGVAPGTAVIRANAGPYIPEATANITVLPTGAILLPSGMTLAPGQSAAFPVTLATAAPSGGIAVILSSSDATKVTVSPASVNIPAGQTAPATQPQVTGVTFGTANISAAASGYTTATQPVQVGATISFSSQNPTIAGLTTLNLPLTLSAPAPAGGLTINLTSSNPGIATVPATVSFAANATSVNVLVKAVAVGTTIITAAAGAPNIPNATANLTVQSSGTLTGPGNLSVGLGQSAGFAVSLPAPAPAGGVQITLSTSDATKVTVPPSPVTIAAGQTAPATQPQVGGAGLGTANVTASAPGYTSVSAAVHVTATVGFSPQNLTITGTATQNLTLNLSAPAPAGGVQISLSSANPGVATVPGSVTIAAGASSVAVPVTGVAPGSTVLHASALPNIPDATADVTVQSPGAINLPSSTTVALGQSAPFVVTLPAPAPVALTVTLASSVGSKVTISPSSVSIAAGQSAPASQPSVHGVDIGTANITASAPGYVSAVAPVQVTATVAFASQNVTITGIGSQNVALNLSAPAPAAGLSVSLSSGNPAVVAVPASVTFPANATSINVPLTALTLGAAVIHAGAPPYIADATANVTVQSAGNIGVPAGATVGLGQTVALPVTLSAPAPANLTVTLSSSDTSKVTVTPTVTILAGQSAPATQPQVTGAAPGTANISVSAPGYTPASAAVQVTASVSFASQNVTITGLKTQNLTLNLSGPAPAGGLTINVSSSNTSIVTVPATVTFAAGTASVPVPLTTVALGTAVIHAAAAPLIADTTANVTVVTAGVIGLPANASVGLGKSAQLAVTLPAAAPAGGVAVTLTSSDGSRVAVTTTVTIPAGQTTPAAPAQISGINVGTATVTASAPGYTAASVPVQVTATVAFTPNTLAITGLTTQNLQLSLSAAAPSGGLTVSLSSGAPGIASVPTTATFAAGSTSVNVPVTALAGGTAVIHAGAPPSIPDTTATVTVTIPIIGNIILTDASVGKDLEIVYGVALSASAPAGGVRITLTSSNASALLIAGNGSSNVGTGSLTISIPAGMSSVTGIYLQGLVDTGTATVTAAVAAGDWAPATGTITLTPSGFVLAGPNGIGVPSFGTYVGVKTAMTVSPARLDASRQFQETQLLRGGVSVTVPVGSSNTTVGTLSPVSLTFTGGVDSSLTTQFTAKAVGNATMTAAAPSGFSTPAFGGNQVAANVAATALKAPNLTVGHNLQASAQIQLDGVPGADLPVTITSTAPDRVLFATSPVASGLASISITVGAGRTISPEFYVLGVAGGATGPVSYTVSASGGFGNTTGTVTLARSGIVIAGPFGMGNPVQTTQGSAPSQLTVYSGWLDDARNFKEQQAIAGTSAVTVTVSSQNPAVGTITVSPVSIAPGWPSAATAFQPAQQGTTTISVSQPPGFTVPAAFASLTAEVTTAGISVTDGVFIGRNLQVPGTFALGHSAPTGGVVLTLTSNSPKLKLSTTGTDAGSNSITINVPGGGFNGSFHLYGLDSSGTATYTASAPGYASRQGTVDLTPSGVVLEGLFPIEWGMQYLAPATAGGPDVPFSVHPAQLDAAGNFGSIQALAGGMSLPVSLTSSATAIGTVPDLVTITGGNDTVAVPFTPLAVGSTIITADAGPDYTSAGPAASLTASVK
jgi:trimeric autotransporter adhesin